MDEEFLVGMNERLGLGLHDLGLLRTALCTDRVCCSNEGLNEGECCNCALAEVGDAVLELVLAETLCSEGKKGRRINEVRRSSERRQLMRNMAVKESICSSEESDSRFIEAITGAKMMDSGYYGCRDWITKWLRPRLTEMMGKDLGQCPAKGERRGCSKGGRTSGGSDPDVSGSLV